MGREDEAEGGAGGREEELDPIAYANIPDDAVVVHIVLHLPDIVLTMIVSTSRPHSSTRLPHDALLTVQSEIRIDLTRRMQVCSLTPAVNPHKAKLRTLHGHDGKFLAGVSAVERVHGVGGKAVESVVYWIDEADDCECDQRLVKERISKSTPKSLF